jgi:hypothetical protein
MNCSLEFHDSRVASVQSAGDVAAINFEGAYLQRSNGAPGSDEGTECIQAVSLEFASADEPLHKRETQLQVKDMGFMDERLKDGRIGKTPLNEIEYDLTTTTECVISKGFDAVEDKTTPKIEGMSSFAAHETGSEMPTGRGGEEPLQLPEEACFVAGTPVHTERGLVPIEQIRIGDRVLSRPETGGEITYKPVANTFVHADKEICVLQFMVHNEIVSRSAVATLNHPFWIDKVGWVAAGEVRPGNKLFLHDGQEAFVVRVAKVLQTEIPEVGWTHDDDGSFEGPTIDMRGAGVRVSAAYTEDEVNHSALEIGKPYLATVYNFEVEDNHTYFVGDAGVWAHNDNCGEAEGTVKDGDQHRHRESL